MADDAVGGGLGLDAFVEALGMLPKGTDAVMGANDASAASTASSVVTMDAAAAVEAPPRTTRTVIDNMPGVPPGLVVEDVWDGRCFALLHSRDPLTQLHYRCTYTVSEGSLFCLAYHKHERERACGTVWQHKSRCTACHRDKNARFRAQDPPHADMRFAPDRPAGAKRVRSSEEAAAAQRETVAPPPAAAVVEISRTRGHGYHHTPAVARAPTRAEEDDFGVDDVPAVKPPTVATGVRVNQLLGTPAVGSREWEHESRFVGPSGIRLRVRLACMLQPANWCAEAPRMMTCLSDAGDAVPDEATAADGSSSAPARSPVPPLPAHLLAGTAALEEVLRTSVSSELTSAPMSGDTWLTSSFIDFIALKVARAYPRVHFLPSSFMAFDLPNACKALDTLHAFVPQDLLGRPVKLRADAIPPAVYDTDDVTLLDVDGVPQPGLPSVLAAEEAAFLAAHPPPAPPPATSDNGRGHGISHSVSFTHPATAWGPRTGTPSVALPPPAAPAGAHPAVLSASLGIGNSPMLPIGAETTATFSPFMLGMAPFAAPQEPLDLPAAMRAWPPQVPTPPTLSMNMMQGAQVAGMRGFPGMNMTPLMGGIGMHPATAAFVAMHGNSWNMNAGGPQMMPGMHGGPQGMFPPHMHGFMPPMPGPGMPDGMQGMMQTLTPPWMAMSAPPMPDMGMMHAYHSHAQLHAAAAAAAAAASQPAPAPMQLRAAAATPAPVFIPAVRTDAPAHYTKPASYASPNRPLVFFWNIGNMHWNLVRVFTGSSKHIEVFEPMGRPTSRSQGGYASAGLSLRSVPRTLITWLDAVCPLPTPGGWRARTRSAITSQQQGNGFDCGVACLLYAEKCAQGREKEDICDGTDQSEITAYRAQLMQVINMLAGAVHSDNSMPMEAAPEDDVAQPPPVEASTGPIAAL